MNKIKRHLYSDLMNQSNKVNAFKHPDAFKYNQKSSEDLQFLSTITVEEYELFRYSNEDSFGFDKQFTDLFAKKVLIPNKIIIALIADPTLKPLSKLRSYKGILNTKLKNRSQFLEQELIVKGQSVIGGYSAA